MAKPTGTRTSFDKEFLKFQEYIRKLTTEPGKKAFSNATNILARQAAAMVRRAYKSSDYPRTEGTLRGYARPPLGSDRSKKVWAGTRSLSRSGTLANSVIIRKHPDKSAHGWQTLIDPTKTYTTGDPQDSWRGIKVAQIADYQEFGRNYNVTVTPAMLRYLHAAGIFTGEGGGNVMGQPMLIQLPPKPVWEPVHRAMKTELKGLDKHIKIYFGRHTIGKTDESK